MLYGGRECDVGRKALGEITRSRNKIPEKNAGSMKFGKKKK